MLLWKLGGPGAGTKWRPGWAWCVMLLSCACVEPSGAAQNQLALRQLKQDARPDALGRAQPREPVHSLRGIRYNSISFYGFRISDKILNIAFHLPKQWIHIYFEMCMIVCDNFNIWLFNIFACLSIRSFCPLVGLVWDALCICSIIETL